MILPDDVDEKVEFWVGETDSESDHSDVETIIGGRSERSSSSTCKTRTNTAARLADSRSTKSENGIGSRKRRKLGNGLMAVQPLTRNSHTFALRLETRGNNTLAADAPKRMPREKKWSVVRGLPNTVSSPCYRHSSGLTRFIGERTSTITYCARCSIYPWTIYV